MRNKNVDNIDKKEKDKKEKRKKIPSKVKKVIILVLVILIIIAGIYFAVCAHLWKTTAQDMLLDKNSVVVDTDGDTIAQIGSEKKKKKVSYKEMPDNLKNAYVAIEDERFYKHHGVDAKRTLSAIASYAIHFGSSSFGGSTITQQLVKNMTGDDSGSITRKVKEWGKAYTLEQVASKEEILETYLNVIYVGDNSFGVEMAANYYFDKSVSDLDLVECAFLAGINHAPNAYNPFENKDNEEKIENRTKTVLAKMLELEYINEQEYKEAINEVDRGIEFKEGKTKAHSDGVYSYHTDALIIDVVEDIANKKNISKTFATNYINMAGLTIHSTQDTDIQDEIEEEFEKSKYQLSSKEGRDSSQAAMVIMDHTTGAVVGCVGGLGEKTDARGLNRATQSVRQTGSASKPIAVLVPALDKRIITAATHYDDVATTFEGGYAPGDYDGYKGNISVRRAVESSQNIPFVKIMEELKPKNAIKYMKKMGITTLTEEDETLPLALGGLQKGISPLEMAGAYSTIANDGVYIEPTFYSKITYPDKSVLLESKQKSKKVFSKAVAYILKELLIEPVKGEHGTATYCSISNMDVAAKTGTTDENYDRWLCGFTPYYTAVTWYGYDYNESINYSGRNPAGILWSQIMKRIHRNLDGKEFEMPSGVVTDLICSSSGMIANSGCPDTYTEYFLRWTTPKECTEHSGKVDKRVYTRNNNQKTNKKENATKRQTTVEIETETQEYERPSRQESTPNKSDEIQNTNKTNESETNNTVTNREDQKTNTTSKNESASSNTSSSTDTEKQEDTSSNRVVDETSGE